MIVDVLMPKMGESITEGTIIEWKKNIGDTIEKDETLLEISTDKVDSEIPCPSAGKILALLYDKNETVEVNTIIAKIGTEEEENIDIDSESFSKEEQIIIEDKKSDIKSIPKEIEEIKSNNEENNNKIDRVFYSPLVKSIALKEGVSIEELSNINGSGYNNRVNKNDLLEYVKTKETPINTQNTIAQSIEFNDGNSLQSSIEKMDRVRLKIAKHMIQSKETSAHVYTTSEVDVTNIVLMRNNKKDDFLKKNELKLTYTPIIVSACIKAIQEFPMINCSIDGENIIHHKNINMGIAVALPNNNLIVPVIKSSEEKNFLGLTRSIDNLAKKARSNSLTPDAIFGSTFTVTNPGIFGGLFGMPIINQPNVAILSVGSIEKKPVVKETEFGDAVFVRHMMYLTLGYDHRLIDGAYGTRFLSRVKELLEKYNEQEIIV